MAVQPPTAPALSPAPPCPPGEEFELHFIGELEFGWEFPGLSSDDGLFIDYAAEAGSDWLPIARKEGFVGQTQTTYADAEGVYVFNHPLDFHFIADSLAGWPQLHVQVFKLDAAGRVETIAYGSSALPSMPGHAELTCRTWRPLKSSIMEEAGTFSRSASVRFWKLHPEVHGIRVFKSGPSTWSFIKSKGQFIRENH
ncbi:b9d2 [Symbiodinium pilosum]|uniref:B9 domain-containing protein 2 n=1 Tax=Symbiodinium pilosum TaxID=2952 RepID=A0A812WLI3_SYMPI|nr:b9d2 [Symbiodinium pilosum]